MPDKSVDYVVVGAGTAGCIIAARLSADPGVTVTLLETGGMDTNPAIYDQSSLNPMFSLWGKNGPENWGYETEPQPELGGRSVEIARGKVLGGSSAVNAMIYIRGHQRDFDTWAELGNQGWAYNDVLPYFKKSETYHGPPSSFHGDRGPLSVIDYMKPSEAGHAFIQAAAGLGQSKKYNDFNAGTQEAGGGFYQSTKTPDGVRVTAASAFITPNLGRENLHLQTHMRATKIVVEGGRAVGVKCTGVDGPQMIRSEREVIVCCGAFETPKLLLLSGLGPAEDLRTHGIPVIQDLRGVGRNLQDHLLLGVGYESLVPLDPPEMLAEAGLFIRTGSESDEASPDLQYFFGPVQFVAPEYMIEGPGFTFAPILTQPHSRGTVTLNSTDPSALARVDPQYLSDERDMAVFEHGIRYARELVNSPAFDKIRGRELAPGPDITSTADLHDYIRQSASTVWHPAGTCKMGPDQDAVVDSQLRVHNIEGLRIADASVMPKLVNANPNAAVMMIAEKAADLIRQQA